MNDGHLQHSAATISGHIAIAITLIALTGLNIFIHSLGLEPPNGTRLILFIAAIQAFLVLEFLMHLINGERTVIGLVIITLIFVGALVFGSGYDDSYGSPLVSEAGADSRDTAEHDAAEGH